MQVERTPRAARLIAIGLTLAAFVSVVATLWAPGITVDEPLDVRPGRNYLRLLERTGTRFLTPPVIDETYGDNKEHPPLGRWLLGVASRLVEPVELLVRGRDPVGVYVRSGRLAPALAFALLVGLVAWECRPYGAAAMVGGGSALVLMPRMFAHAHLAALDTFVALFWTWAFLNARRALASARPVRSMALSGIILGLALLTKIHGWLLIPLIMVWAFARLRWRQAALAAAAWIIVGACVFFVGWPWLWVDPVGRLTAYLSTGVDRVSILVLYFGTIYRDVDVPWHYPWVYFAATVPIGLHAFGILGGFRAATERPRHEGWLLLGLAMLLWLVVFSTRVRVYDGERLFLPVFPLWAIAIGRGVSAAWDRAGQARVWRMAVVVVIGAQAFGLVRTFPFGLSYYNTFVGGLPGAERLGLELTFWGDTVDDALIGAVEREVGDDARVCLVPTLAPEQGKMVTSARLLARDIIIGDQPELPRSEWVVVYRRPAYWPSELAQIVATRPVALREREGVWLSGLWRRDARKSPASN